MTSQRQREANRRNGTKSLGPVSTKGKLRSSQNALKHGLSSADVVPIDHPLKPTLMADARARGLDALAAEELVTSILQHQRVCDAYAEIYERDMNEHGAPNVVDGGRVRRLTVDDLMRVWELSNRAGSRISPLGQQLLAAMDAGYQVGHVLTDTTVKTLRGLERHLQRSAARIAKAVRAG